jgi:Ca2+-binding EF-hand superfamily protein
LNLPPRLRISLREITSVFKLLDVNGDGKVSREELIGALCEVKDIAM